MKQLLQSKSSFLVGLALIGVLILVGTASAVPPSPMGTAPSSRPVDTNTVESLDQMQTFYGLVTLSVDAMGTTAGSGTIQVDKPANASVRKAYLMLATTGSTSHELTAGDVQLAGSPVVWNESLANSISSYNYWAEVTAIVKPIVDAAPAGLVDLQITEANSVDIDGEILAVVFEDPNQTTENTIILYFGAQDVDGDTFTIDFGEPIDKSDPNLVMDYSLGISYSCQDPLCTDQDSYVDVNGTRLTSSAGGQDDGAAANGALITVGGIGDSNDNPPDPNGDAGGDFRYDDELYSVIPFVDDGDTQMVVNTVNPSGDDNIFFAALFLGSTRSVNTIDVDISLHNNPTTAAARAPYESIINYFADAIYEASNGAHKIGRVRFYPNGGESDTADIVWVHLCHPSASPAGVAIAGLHVNMCDVFEDGSGAGSDYDFLANDNNQKGGGYTLAHEYGHYYYGLYDEYIGVPSYDHIFHFPHSTDNDVANSIMNSQWNAMGGDYDWLNFSIDKHFTNANAQDRVYDASGWATLTREVHEDPRDGQRLALWVRAYYPELEDVAPEGNNDSSIELPTADARDQVNIVWMTATRSPQDAAADPIPLTAHVNSLLGQNINYPDPIVLMAYAKKQWTVNDMVVSGTVKLPDQATMSIEFKDDGMPPDAVADDGLYSALFSPDQNGIYEVETVFYVLANESQLVPTAFAPAAGPNGAVPYAAPQVITESITMTDTLQIAVSNVVDDDHGDIPDEATPTTTDNMNVSGKIEVAGDADVFSMTTTVTGTTYVRVSNLALNMTPHVRVFGPDGTTVLFEQAFDSQENDYLSLPLQNVDPGTIVFVEVTDVSPTASGGLYQISAGPQLVGDDTPGWSTYLPVILDD